MTLNSAWVAGEALIDLIPDSQGLIQSIVGGGAANTSQALAKLGVETYFIGGISTDQYGLLVREKLSKASVNLVCAFTSDSPTSVAEVSIEESGSVSYSFVLEETASFQFDLDWLPDGNPKVLHVGTLGTLIEPGASNLFEWARKLQCPIVFDPNVRPSVLEDRVAYRTSVERWLSIADVVKLSIEDFNWLYPELVDPADLLNFGPSLIVVTFGPKGLGAIYDGGKVSVPGVPVEVSDTVGAGDTVGAVLLEAIILGGLSSLRSNLESVLERAAKAAAITCSRAGANPPSREELEAF